MKGMDKLAKFLSTPVGVVVGQNQNREQSTSTPVRYGWINPRYSRSKSITFGYAIK